MNPVGNAVSLILKRNRRYYFLITLIFLVLFINSFFAGQHLYRTETDKAMEIMEKLRESPKIQFISDSIFSGQYSIAAMTIFFNNFLIDVASLYLGVLPFVPVLIVLINSVFLGTVFGIQSLLDPISGWFHISLISLVGILELSAMVLVTYEGLRLGFGILKPSLFGKGTRKTIFVKNITEATQILFLVMVLLLLGAIVETTGIAILGSRIFS